LETIMMRGLRGLTLALMGCLLVGTLGVGQGPAPRKDAAPIEEPRIDEAALKRYQAVADEAAALLREEERALFEMKKSGILNLAELKKQEARVVELRKKAEDAAAKLADARTRVAPAGVLETERLRKEIEALRLEMQRGFAQAKDREQLLQAVAAAERKGREIQEKAEAERVAAVKKFDADLAKADADRRELLKKVEAEAAKGESSVREIVKKLEQSESERRDLVKKFDAENAKADAALGEASKKAEAERKELLKKLDVEIAKGEAAYSEASKKAEAERKDLAKKLELSDAERREAVKKAELEAARSEAALREVGKKLDLSEAERRALGKKIEAETARVIAATEKATAGEIERRALLERSKLLEQRIVELEKQLKNKPEPKPPIPK
jgi:hypothetical protein